MCILGLYPRFYFSTPILTVLIPVIFHNLTKRLAPSVHAVLAGGPTGRAARSKARTVEAGLTRTTGPAHKSAKKKVNR